MTFTSHPEFIAAFGPLVLGGLVLLHILPHAIGEAGLWA